MMNLDDLWIGDKILVKSAGEVGTYEKKVNAATAIIKFIIGTSEIDIEDMELANDKPLGPLKPKKEKVVTDKIEIIGEEPEGLNLNNKANFKNEIDLHFEKLFPHNKKSNITNVLDAQVAACKNYIEQAIYFRAPEIKIIHGKGNGTLRDAVVDLLRDYQQNIHWNFEGENKGGAVTVMLKYEKI